MSIPRFYFNLKGWGFLQYFGLKIRNRNLSAFLKCLNSNLEGPSPSQSPRLARAAHSFHLLFKTISLDFKLETTLSNRTIIRYPPCRGRQCTDGKIQRRREWQILQTSFFLPLLLRPGMKPCTKHYGLFLEMWRSSRNLRKLNWGDSLLRMIKAERPNSEQHVLEGVWNKRRGTCVVQTW